MFLCVIARFRRRSEAEALGLSVEEVRAIAQGNVRVWKKVIAPFIFYNILGKTHSPARSSKLRANM